MPGPLYFPVAVTLAFPEIVMLPQFPSEPAEPMPAEPLTVAVAVTFASPVMVMLPQYPPFPDAPIPTPPLATIVPPSITMSPQGNT